MAQMLIVDNHPLMRQYLTELLAREGHEVHAAEDGLAALDCLRKLHPQMIFVDLIMPNIDGMTLCRIIRRLPGHAETCIVILSAVVIEAPELVEHSGAIGKCLNMILWDLLFHYDADECIRLYEVDHAKY